MIGAVNQGAIALKSIIASGAWIAKAISAGADHPLLSLASERIGNRLLRNHPAQ